MSIGLCAVSIESIGVLIDPLSLPEGPVESDADNSKDKPSTGQNHEEYC